MAVLPEKSGFPLGWFINQPLVRKMHECSVCLEVLKDAVQIKDCGHQFCRVCLNDVLRSDPRCPTCRRQISDELIFTDNAANRVIGNLDVNCPSSGCEWEGSLNDLLQQHTNVCPFFVVSCSNNGCNAQVTRREFNSHISEECEYRTVVCVYCEEVFAFNRKNDHNEICFFLPLECSLCLQNNIPRCKMAKHLDLHCNKTVIECSYSEFGCTYQCERGRLEEHLSLEMNYHLKLSTLEISRLKDQYEKNMQQMIAKYEKEIKEMKAKVILTPPYLMIITDFKKKLFEAKVSNTRGGVAGEPFYTSALGYKMKMRVYLDGAKEQHKDHLGVYIFVMRSDHDAVLSWPLKKKCTFTLIDQQDNEKEKQNIVHILTPGGENNFKRPRCEENDGWGFGRFVSHDILNTRKYIKDDTVFITLDIEQ